MQSYYHDHKGILPSARVRYRFKPVDYFRLDPDKIFSKCRTPHDALCVVNNARMKDVFSVELEVVHLATEKWGSEFTRLLKNFEVDGDVSSSD